MDQCALDRQRCCVLVQCQVILEGTPVAELLSEKIMDHKNPFSRPQPRPERVSEPLFVISVHLELNWW